MLSVAGIYDGKSIYPIDKIEGHKKYKVIITFVEELDSKEADEMGLRNFGTYNASLEFWNDPLEDVYQDYLTNPETK